MFDGIEFEFVGQGYCVGVADKSDIETINDILKDPKNKALLPARTKLAWENKSVYGTARGDYRLVVLKEKLMDGAGITNAEAHSGGFGVSMTMDSEHTAKWADITAKNIGNQIAIVMDDVVYSAPVVQGRIEGASSITGNFTVQESEDLAGVLWHGRLPVDPTIVTLEVSER
jgi:SecD/SecF fusion protein